ncbi:MAG: hypothetical protein ACI8VC_001481 [Candidatus Endobugula sp.]
MSEDQKTESLAPKDVSTALKGEKSSAQQRRNPRFKVNWSSRALMADKRIIAVRTKDVSVGGVGFECGESLPVGSNVSIELTPWVGGKKYAIRAKCLVTYNMLLAGNAGFSHGVRFTFVPPKQLEELKIILKSLGA